MVDVGDAARDVGERLRERGVLRARGNRFSEVDCFKNGLGVIEEGRLGYLLDVVCKEELGLMRREP